jgi:hypothetical protein
MVYFSYSLTSAPQLPRTTMGKVPVAFGGKVEHVQVRYINS